MHLNFEGCTDEKGENIYRTKSFSNS
ncbi:DUF1659 domain-containing protein [Halobacillus litoralis]|nr:DUF1659 domain-containing protein [Halobacillus litoralis]